MMEVYEYLLTFMQPIEACCDINLCLTLHFIKQHLIYGHAMTLT